MSRVLTRHDVAALLGVQPCTVDKERRRGKLGSVKVGGRWRFLPEQVDAYLAANTVDPREAQPRAKNATPKPRPMVDAQVAYDNAVAKFGKPRGKLLG